MPQMKDRPGQGSGQEMERIRAALYVEIQSSSLRTVASQVEMSPTGLQNFIDGTVPYTRTLTRLRTWYSRWRGRDGVDSREVQRMLVGLMRNVSDPAAGALAVAECIAQLHKAEAQDVPEWVPEVHSALAASACSGRPVENAPTLDDQRERIP